MHWLRSFVRSLSVSDREAFVVTAGVLGLLVVLVLTGCAMPDYEVDHWRDAVRNERGLIRGS